MVRSRRHPGGDAGLALRAWNRHARTWSRGGAPHRDHLPCRRAHRIVARSPAPRAIAAVHQRANGARARLQLLVASRCRPFACALRAGCGLGDIFVGAVAPLVAWLVYRQPDNSRPILWIWNIVGALDLIDAVFLGATSSPGPVRLFFGEPSAAIMTTLPWLLIPGFLVPLLFAVHIGIHVRLTANAPR